MSLTVPQTPSARARREAMKEWWSAQNGVNRQREAAEDWDPAVQAQTDQETWRRQLIAGSRRHELQRAARAAARAQALARTPGERYAASELAWRIAADSGNPRAEFAAAQLLVRLDPRNPVSQLALRHAALAEGRRRLVRKDGVGLETLRDGSVSSPAFSGGRPHLAEARREAPHGGAQENQSSLP
jgi:hypothetical protein